MFKYCFQNGIYGNYLKINIVFSGDGYSVIYQR